MPKPCKKCGSTERYKSGNCAPCSRACSRRWARANPEKVKKHKRRWRETNPEKVRKHKSRWHRANPKKAREHRRKWRRVNPEKVREYNREWKQANPEKVVALQSNRRARKRANGGILTAAEIKDMYSTYPLCLVCGTDEDLSLDHVIPLAKGGKNSIENIQVLCCSCNSSKGTRTIDYRDEMIKRWRQLKWPL